MTCTRAGHSFTTAYYCLKSVIQSGSDHTTRPLGIIITLATVRAREVISVEQVVYVYIRTETLVNVHRAGKVQADETVCVSGILSCFRNVSLIVSRRFSVREVKSAERKANAIAEVIRRCEVTSKLAHEQKVFLRELHFL